MINEMREEVNKLRTENENLKKENDRLEKSTKKLQDVEQKLKDISVLQGKSVDELVKQVQEFKQIQESIKVRICCCARSVLERNLKSFG